VVELRKLPHPPTHFGGHHHLRVGRMQLAAEALAAAVAVDVCGVKERDSVIDTSSQHGARLILGDGAPLRPDLPGSESHHADRPPEPLDRALFHRRMLARLRVAGGRPYKRPPHTPTTGGHDARIASSTGTAGAPRRRRRGRTRGCTAVDRRYGSRLSGPLA